MRARSSQELRDGATSARSLRFRVIVGAVTVLVLCGGAWVSRAERSSTGLVPFSHTLHRDEVEAECLDCHGGVTQSLQSADVLLPPLETCYECHETDEPIWSDLNAARQTTPELSAFASPDRELVFDHQLHLEFEGVECESCHRGVEDGTGDEQMTLPAMSACMTCHDDRLASSECMLCHSDPLALRPASHTGEWMHRHESMVRAGDQSCATCHRTNDCQECHDADLSVVSLAEPRAFMSNDAPSHTSSSGLILDRAHALDYRYTHGPDARANGRDCRVCHEPQVFCTECHAAGDGGSGLRPLTHGGADWGAIPGGVGTGGGRHAELARRDLESCAACHDVQGEDPTCLTCHRDTNPGLGNDPRTHEPGFMRGVQGLWHDDRGDVCFSCHTPSSLAGVGFCTYCHEAR